jgi:apolipoprotein D and lipocalin family protein
MIMSEIERSFFAVQTPARLPFTRWRRVAIRLAASIAVAGLWPHAIAPAADHAPLPTAQHVDLARYAGVWHEVARLPNPFQRSCVGATARYTLLPDGGMGVVNTCATARGRCRSIEGRAEVVPCSGNARLRVRFSGIAGLVPVSREGNYWIIAVDEDYQWAVVGTPDRRFLWILARDRSLPPDLDVALVERARCLGFDVSRLVR